ncbi:bifunctional phosphoglucose/phosphomannose isomerase [Thermofilum pendens]|nr:bifunctional phosphoglucose/phosphomannose isomerase [Thermofilum pendens]
MSKQAYRRYYEAISPNAHEVDKLGMLVQAVTFPESLMHGIGAYSRLHKLLHSKIPVSPKGIVVSGMGGSFIGGLFLQDVLYSRAKVPLILLRDTYLPAFVDENYLLVAVSYSGNTEETIRVVAQATQAKVPVVAVTSGGLLQRFAEKYGLPVVSLPMGLPPRAAFPYMACALSAIVEVAIGEANLLSEIESCAENLSARRDEVFSRASESAENVKSLVEKGLTPLVYSYRPYISAGYRFKTQLNENAKIHAFYADLPEANHNEIMGWSSPLAGKFFAVLIRGREEPFYMDARISFLRELFETQGIPFLEQKPVFDAPHTCELLQLIYMLDLVSVAVALKMGVDPTPVDTITKLKKVLDARINLKEELGLE